MAVILPLDLLDALLARCEELAEFGVTDLAELVRQIDEIADPFRLED